MPGIFLVLSKGSGDVDGTPGNNGSSLSCRHSHGRFFTELDAGVYSLHPVLDVEQLLGSSSASFRSWWSSKRMSYLATRNSRTNSEYLISLLLRLCLSSRYSFPSNPEPGGNIQLDLTPQPDSVLEASLVFPFTYASFLACPESPDFSHFIKRWH